MKKNTLKENYIKYKQDPNSIAKFLTIFGKGKAERNIILLCFEQYEKTKIDYFRITFNIFIDFKILLHEILKSNLKDKKLFLKLLKIEFLKRIDNSRLAELPHSNSIYSHLRSIIFANYREAMRTIDKN